MVEIDPFIVALVVAALGGVLSAVLGWLGGTEPFETRKFVYGVVRAAVGGAVLVFALGTPVDNQGLALLFFAAMGIDVGSYNGYKAVTKK